MGVTMKLASVGRTLPSAGSGQACPSPLTLVLKCREFRYQEHQHQDQRQRTGASAPQTAALQKQNRQPDRFFRLAA